jgi:hypothetical protein
VTWTKLRRTVTFSRSLCLNRRNVSNVSRKFPSRRYATHVIGMLPYSRSLTSACLCIDSMEELLSDFLLLFVFASLRCLTESIRLEDYRLIGTAMRIKQATNQCRSKTTCTKINGSYLISVENELDKRDEETIRCPCFESPEPRSSFSL